MRVLIVAAGAVIALVAIVLGLTVGAADLGLADLFEVWFREASDPNRTILLDIRLPRVLQAALVGGALAVTGAVFQALLRNPLAEPYILGVSGGAAVGATLALVLGFAGAGAWHLPVAAFTGAVLTVLGVLGVTLRAAGTLDSRVLLLAGVVLGAFFNALIMLVITFVSPETFRAAILWTMGSFSASTWGSLSTLLVYLTPAIVALLLMARPLNLLVSGEQTAFYLGVEVSRVRLAAYLITSLAVAATVSVSGAIGFVGLVVPHAVRLAGATDYRLLIPTSLFAGAAFLVLSDTVARTALAPTELPVGVVTALVGVPVFFLLLMRGTR